MLSYFFVINPIITNNKTIDMHQEIEALARTVKEAKSELSQIHTHLKNTEGKLYAIEHNYQKSLMKRLDAVVSELTEEASFLFKEEGQEYVLLFHCLDTLALILADERFGPILD